MVVDDILSGEGEYIPASFYLQKVTFDPFGAVKEYGEEVPFQLQMAADRRSFKIEFGDVLSGQAYLLTYRTTYRQDISVNNAIHLKAEGIETTYKSDFIDSSTTGTATGKPAPSEAPSAASGTAPGGQPLISLAGQNPLALSILAGVLLLGVLIVALNRKRS